MTHADKARETYRDDPFVSNEEYGRLVEEADQQDQQEEFEAEREPLECLDGPEGCSGAIEYRTALSPSGRAFPRCDKHWEARLDKEDASFSWRSVAAPSWFDPSYAGESWDED